ncbi:MAG: PAS domain-containing protein [Deltaproteobacteria bacterium]|nr:PAS domain-containing protein [Deltaproteobacteria bacterium]
MKQVDLFPNQTEQSLKHLSRVLRLGSVGLWEIELDDADPAAGKAFFNDGSKNILGLSLPNGSGLPLSAFFTDFVHPQDIGDFSKVLTDLPYDEQFRVEVRIKRRQDGAYRWFKMDGLCESRDDVSKKAKIVGLIEEIDERRQAQQALRQALAEKEAASLNHVRERDRLSAVIEAAELGTWDWDIATGKVKYNKRWAEIIGYALEEISGGVDTWEKALLPEDLHKAAKAIEDHCKGLTEMYQADFRIRHRNGSIVWAQDRGRVVERDQDGKALRLMGVMLDVSKQKSVELALKEKSDQLELVFKAARIGAWDWDIARGTLKFNDVYLDMLGYKPEEITGTIDEWESFVHPDDLDSANAALERVISGEDDMYAKEIRMRHKDGRYIWTYDFGRIAYRDEHGVALRMIGGHFDFEEKKKMESDFTSMQEHERELRLAKELAEESTKAKSEFLANMSHEIRTPMNAIIGLTHLVLDTELDSHQLNYIKRTEEAAQALLRIINDILDFSKIEAGKLEMEQTEFQLMDVLNSMINLLGIKAQEKGLEFSFVLNKDVPCDLVGDPVRLGQILNNLASNAIKFTFDGEIGVHASVKEIQDDKVLLFFEVTDTGIGLTQEQQQSLFTAFTQADTSTTRKFGGTGLGLTISKRLVEMMGGNIWCTSKLGEGSTFAFTAFFKLSKPLKPSDIKSQATCVKTHTIKKTDLQPIKGAQILLTEDNEVNQLVASRILINAGFYVDIANNGLEAVDMVQKKKYDLVLMDIQMPEMDGLTATKTIRAMDGFAEIPIVAMTAHAMSGDRELSIASGMNDHVSKPINIQELFAALLKWMKPINV